MLETMSKAGWVEGGGEQLGVHLSERDCDEDREHSQQDHNDQGLDLAYCIGTQDLDRGNHHYHTCGEEIRRGGARTFADEQGNGIAAERHRHHRGDDDRREVEEPGKCPDEMPDSESLG